MPEPFAALLLDYTTARPNTKTATNPDSRWLFPGRRADQPLHPSTIEKRLGDLGFSPARARTSAIRQLVLQAPAPVVARMLGYHNDSVAIIAAQGRPLEPLRTRRPHTVTDFALHPGNTRADWL